MIALLFRTAVRERNPPPAGKPKEYGNLEIENRSSEIWESPSPWVAHIGVLVRRTHLAPRSARRIEIVFDTAQATPKGSRPESGKTAHTLIWVDATVATAVPRAELTRSKERLQGTKTTT